MADLQLLAVFAQETAVRLLMPTLDDSEATPALTAREQEILRWTLAGKSSSVIGEILHISLSTVNYHLRSAMSKLAVSSKHQAAAKAHALGLL
jgi:DNA-binding CsgD family transcriptional regulator